MLRRVPSPLRSGATKLPRLTRFGELLSATPRLAMQRERDRRTEPTGVGNNQPTPLWRWVTRQAKLTAARASHTAFKTR